MSQMASADGRAGRLRLVSMGFHLVQPGKNNDVTHNYMFATSPLSVYSEYLLNIALGIHRKKLSINITHLKVEVVLG